MQPVREIQPLKSSATTSKDLEGKQSIGIARIEITHGMYPRQPAFVPTIAVLTEASVTPSACARQCNGCNGTGRVKLGRRSVLRNAGSSLLGGFLGIALSVRGAGAAGKEKVKGPVEEQENETTCNNCLGSGTIPCELCSGTGFWRALSGNDPKQLYKGVVCPECEGAGKLPCPVCLGTGEGNIKGLLRRRRVPPGKGRVLQSN